MTNKITIKNINNKEYVYEWEYIPVNKREHKEKRFRWRSKGPLLDYVHEIPKNELIDASQEIFEKTYITMLKKRMKELECQKPFSDKLLEIEEVPKAGRKMLRKELREELGIEADKFVSEILSDYTPESLWNYFKDGGTIGELLEEEKKPA